MPECYDIHDYQDEDDYLDLESDDPVLDDDDDDDDSEEDDD